MPFQILKVNYSDVSHHFSNTAYSKIFHHQTSHLLRDRRDSFLCFGSAMVLGLDIKTLLLRLPHKK
jgi:hypothetical protein